MKTYSIFYTDDTDDDPQFDGLLTFEDDQDMQDWLDIHNRLLKEIGSSREYFTK